MKVYKKLVEEVEEYLESQEPEELADVVEVIYSIVKSKNISLEDFEKIRMNKAEKKGSFTTFLLYSSVFSYFWCKH